MESKPTGAEQITRDLADLYTDESGLNADLETCRDEALDFATQYRGTLAGLGASDLAKAMARLEALQDRVGKAFTYAYLNWSTNTEDSLRGALLQRVREAYTEMAQSLIFFEVEWAAIEEARVNELLSAPEMARYRHYLEVQHQQRKHLLSEPEEKILAEKSVTGGAAWSRFFDETIAAARFELDGAMLPEQEVLAKLHEPDRDLRRRAALSLTAGLEKMRRELAYIFNTLLADKASTDRLRGYENWLSSRNVANEVSDEVVAALVEAVTSRYDLVARYYRLKARLLGLDEMMDYDRYAPIGEADTRYGWPQAREIVLDAYTAFHPRMGGIAGDFFARNWIDAAMKPGKRGGAFSHGAVPSAHPYILMNYTGKIRDVQTLAHELGHGVHQYLSRDQGIFHADTPLTTAETASVSGEMLVFQRLMEAEKGAANRLAMLVGKIDDTIATVFRQIAMNRFEDRVHQARRTEGELQAEQIGEFWLESQRDMFRGSVTLGDHYKYWWSYIPHFVHTPGYVYAYAFGELLVFALYARYRDEGPGFADRYLELLAAGGSDWPHVLVSRLGVDLTDLGFWKNGLGAISDMIDEAEKLAETVVAVN